MGALIVALQLPGFVRKIKFFNGRTASGAIWSIAEGLVTQVLGLVVFIINTRYLGPSSFGALATALVVIEFMKALIFFPVVSSVNSQKVVSDSDYCSAFAINVAASLALCLVLFVIYIGLDQFFPDTGLLALMPFIAGSTILSGLSLVYEARLIRTFEFRSLAVRSILSVSIGGAVGVFMAMNGFGVWSLVSQQLVQQGLALVMIVAFSRWWPTLDITREATTRIVKFAAHVSTSNLVGFFGYQADTIVTMTFLGARDTGLFNSAKRIGTAINQVMIRPLERVALPALVQFSGDKVRLKDAHHRAMGLTALGTAPVFVGVAMLSNDIVRLLLSPQWYAAAPVLSAISIAFLFSTMAQYNKAVVMVSRKPALESFTSLISVVLGSVLLLAAVPFGIVGIAVSVSLRAVFMFPVATIISTRLTESSFVEALDPLKPAFFASVAMALCLFVVSNESSVDNLILRLVCHIGFGALVYGAVLWFLFKRQIQGLIGGFKPAAVEA
jgi:O-antigen/teichoic acid export membrane protein